MNVQEKTLTVILAALVVAALYITFLQPQVPPEEKPDTTYAKELLIKAVEVGKGQDEYIYSYKENSDGYVVEYTLFLKGGEKVVEIESPVSSKKAYFLENDTILCVDFMNVNRCSSVKDITDEYFINYLNSLEWKFFDDDAMEEEIGRLDYFLEKGYLVFSPETPEKTVNGKKCDEVSYVIDYTEMTVSEATRYGISLSAPRFFEFSFCVDNATDLAYRKYFNYTYQGMFHEWSFELLGADWSPAEEITPPENLTEGAYDLLLEEKGWQAQLQNCLSYTGESRDECMHELALTLKNKKICEMAGERRDWCLVTVVGLTADETICPTIVNASFKDDCYIEVAGNKKDSSYCSMIVDSEKAEYCMNVSQVVEEPEPELPEELPPVNETMEEETTPPENETEEENGVDVQELLEYVEHYGENETNETESS